MICITFSWDHLHQWQVSRWSSVTLQVPRSLPVWFFAKWGNPIKHMSCYYPTLIYTLTHFNCKSFHIHLKKSAYKSIPPVVAVQRAAGPSLWVWSAPGRLRDFSNLSDLRSFENKHHPQVRYLDWIPTIFPLVKFFSKFSGQVFGEWGRTEWLPP